MMEIMNLDGETLFKRKVIKDKSLEDLDTTRIPRGVYIVRIQRETCVETTKLYVS